MAGRVVYLTDIKSDEIEAAIHYSIEKGDKL